ncbi:MAG: PepSY domain-containing protein [Candidatus Competibacterales bacterium]
MLGVLLPTAIAQAISADQAAAIAAQATGGRVLSVRLIQRGAPAYYVKVLLAGGRVRTVCVSANSGALC